MGLFDFLSPNKYAAANNVIIAQYLVNNFTNEDRSLFKGQVIRILKAGGMGAAPEAVLLERFNSADKMAQLNFIALAAIDLNYPSPLQGGRFMSIRNPFREIPTDSQLHIATEQMRRANPDKANDIGIEFGKIDLFDW